MKDIQKSEIVAAIAVLALILALANLYAVYNAMSEVEHIHRRLESLEQAVERMTQEVIEYGEMRNLTQYNFIHVSTSEMEIIANDQNTEVVHFWFDGEMAILRVNLPLNTTYRLDIYANSGPQKPWIKGSALEIVINGRSWGIVKFTTEEWSWQYLGVWQMSAGSQEIKLINREEGDLWDTNIAFDQVRILWLKD